MSMWHCKSDICWLGGSKPDDSPLQVRDQLSYSTSYQKLYLSQQDIQIPLKLREELSHIKLSTKLRVIISRILILDLRWRWTSYSHKQIMLFSQTVIHYEIQFCLQINWLIYTQVKPQKYNFQIKQPH